jgi:hypothetical protein
MTYLKVRPFDSWIIRRLISGRDMGVFPDEDAVSRSLRPLVAHLAGLPLEERPSALGGYLCARPDAETFRLALSSVNPDAPPPRDEPLDYATMDDVGRLLSTQAWLWRGWLGQGVLNALAAEPGIGKTRFALDLARRLWLGETWPDGQANDQPRETRTLWVLGDRNFAEVLQALRDFGLPGRALALGTTADDPIGGLDLDEPGNIENLGRRIRAAEPALVVIDTVGMVTARNLCRPEEARAFYAPLIELAAETGVALLGLTHLSLHKEALGRRIVEKARVLMKMTHPDPDNQPDRRRLWVDKTATIEPPALGVAMGTQGNTYDFDPPTEPSETLVRRADRDRPSPKLGACQTWLVERLAASPVRATDIRLEAEQAGYSFSRLYAAREALGIQQVRRDGIAFWALPRTAEEPCDGLQASPTDFPCSVVPSNPVPHGTTENEICFRTKGYGRRVETRPDSGPAGGPV